MPTRKANKVPPGKPSPSPNKTPNPEATAPGARGERPDGGLGRGGVRPGRGSQVRTWLHVSGDSQGVVFTWEGLAGVPRPERRGRGGQKCQSERQGAWELTLFLQTGTAVEARFALAVHRVWREGGEAATWGEKGAGPRVLSGVHTDALVLLPQPLPEQPRAVQRPPTRTRSYILFCCIFQVDK